MALQKTTKEEHNLNNEWTSTNEFVFMDPTIPATSSPERVFIYILMLNTSKANGNKPFYVGKTDNLKKRFVTHKAANWHYKITGSPAKVWVAGTVDMLDAKQALKDLTLEMQTSGYILIENKEHLPKPSKTGEKPKKVKRTPPKYKDLSKLPLDELEEYFHKETNGSKILPIWSKRWSVKHKAIQNKGKRLPDESLVSLGENARLQNPETKDLLPVLRTKKYRSVFAVQAAQKLAENYNPETGESTFTFKGADNPKKREHLLEAARKTVHMISSEWTIKEELDVRKPIRFELTVNVKREVRKKTIKNSM